MQKDTFLNRLKHGLKGLTQLFLGKKTIDQTLFEELEAMLLTADMGVATTRRVLQNLTEQVTRKQLKDPAQLFLSLKQQLLECLQPFAKPIVIPREKKPFVILVVGVNGVGKTTTIAKLAYQFQQDHHKVLLAAGDTFRAAGVTQLQVWGERHHIPVVAQETGADSASVIYDAFVSARSRNFDVLLADTAGRLHTKNNLMEELKKIKRVLGKLDAEAPNEVLLVLDASNGQNAIVQASAFREALSVSGIVLTKLDGTAKGGVIFAITEQLKLPIRWIGVGEQPEDLRPFDAQAFITALFEAETISYKF